MKVRNGYRGSTGAELDEALGAYPISGETAGSIMTEWERWLKSIPGNNGKVHKVSFQIHEQPGGEFWDLAFSRVTFEGSIDAANFLSRQESGFTVYRNSMHKTGKY